MYRKFLVLVVAVCVLGSLLPAPMLAEEPYNMSILVGTMDNPYWLTCTEAAQKAASELGVNLTVLGLDKESNAVQQLSQMEDRIALGDDAILIAVQDTIGLIPGVEQANQAGIPVIAVDKTAEGGEVASVIMTNNIVGAGLGATWLAEQIGGKGKVLVLEGAPGGQTAEDRKNGARIALEKYADIEIISLPADWETGKAQSVTEDVLTANPDLAGIFASNDMMAIGAAGALEAAGMAESVPVCGYDAIPPALEMVSDGRLGATVAQFPDKMGDLGVRFAVRALQGKEIPANVDSGTLLVTPDNVLEFQLQNKPLVAEEPYNMSILVGTMDNPYWLTCTEAAQKAASELGVNLTVLGLDKESNAVQQLSQMEDRIALGDDAILIAVQDTIGLIPGVEQANQAGIPVIAVDKTAEGGEVASVIMTNNIVGAGLGATWLAEQIGGKGKVLVLEGAPGGQTAEDRKNGARIALEKYADIEIISLPADWETGKAQSVTEDVLTANPDLAGIFASNDMMAIGAAGALEAAGMAESVPVCGYDAIPPALEMVSDGRLGATVAQFPGKMGYQGVQYAVRVLQGEDVPSLVDSGTMLVTSNNVDLFADGLYGK